MTFINPYFLFGLFAVLIPIFLHLFNLHKMRKMEFSTLMFLKEIQKSKLRRIKIKQLLLLILRIMIIVLLVFAFSNPVYKGYFSGKNPDIRKAGIIVFDNSFSLSAKDEKGSYIEQAKNSVRNILSLYSPNDKLFLITSSRLKNYDGEYKDIQTLLDSLKNIEFTSVPFELSVLLNSVKDIIKRENFPLYEIFVVSDFQIINLAGENTNKTLFRDIPENVHFYNIDIGNREANNISIDKVELKTKIIQSNNDIKISVILKNHNKFNTINKQINLFVEDKKVAEAVVDLVSLERKEVILTFKYNQKGSIGGYAELLQNDFFEDEILQDNKSYFAYYIPDKVNTGTIGDNDFSTKYIRLAFESAEKLNNPDNSKGPDSYSTTTDLNELIKKSDMIVFSGKKTFSENESVLLAEYIKNGGSIMIFPEKYIDVESYNNFFGKLDAFKIGELMRVSSDTGINNKFERIDFEHPLFSGVFKNEELSITNEKFFVESPKINFMFGIMPNKNSRSLMELAGEKIFLVESEFGEGKLIFCSVSATDDMSDFPMKSLFPLIINRGTFYLGAGAHKNENNIVGRNNVIRIPKNKLYSVPYSVKYKEPGIYSIKDSALNKDFLFALNRDSLESDFHKSELKDIKEYFRSYGLKNVEYVSENSDVNSAILKSRDGTELWKYLVILALIFVILEMLYAKKLERM